jgi:hypothetical protein
LCGEESVYFVRYHYHHIRAEFIFEDAFFFFLLLLLLWSREM